MLIWAFLMGLTIDTFSNTPGVASASLTLIAALQPFVLQLFIPRDSSENFQAGMDTLSIPQYTWYVGHSHLDILCCLLLFRDVQLL